MFTLILLVLVGLGMAVFATQNTLTVPLTIANYTLLDIPMYTIVIGALLIGLFLSWILSLFSGISSAFTLHGKNAALRNAHNTIVKLRDRVHELEMENSRLQGNIPEPAPQEPQEEYRPRPSIFHRLRRSFS